MTTVRTRRFRRVKLVAAQGAAVAVAAVFLVVGVAGVTPGLTSRIDLLQASDGMVRLLSRPETTGRRGSGGGRGTAKGGAPTGGPGAAKSKGRRARTRPASAPLDPQLFATVIERVGNREFSMDAGGFWQVHRLAPATLTAAVQRAEATIDLVNGKSRT